MMIMRITLVFCFFMYTGVFGQEKQILSVEQMQKDLSVLKEAFTELHPGLFRYTTAAQFEKNFNIMNQKAERPMTLAQFYIELSQLTVKLHCGHTYVNPYNQRKAVAKLLYSDQVLPLLFKIINNKVIVTHNLSEGKDIRRGDELVSINGIVTKKIIDSLLTVSKADGLHGRNKQIDNINLSPYLANASRYGLFDIYFSLFFPDKRRNKGFSLVIKHFKGRSKMLTVPSVTKLQRQSQYQKMYPSESQQYAGTFSWFDKNSGYLKINDFTSSGWETEYKQFLDSIFTDLQQNNASNLVIDIRDNEGGDDDVRNEIISYLVKKPFIYPLRRYRSFLSVNKSLLPYLSTWDESFKEPKNPARYMKTSTGLFYKNEAVADTIRPKVNHFAGQVYLITGAKNSSTSFFMADMLQQSKEVIIVGEATGGTKQGINGGQFFFLKLPSSGIEIDLPLIFQAPISKRRDEGVQPSIVIKVKQHDLAGGKDAIISHLQKQLKRDSIFK
jgi:hypothetical protein